MGLRMYSSRARTFGLSWKVAVKTAHGDVVAVFNYDGSPLSGAFRRRC